MTNESGLLVVRCSLGGRGWVISGGTGGGVVGDWDERGKDRRKIIKTMTKKAC